MCSDRAQGLTYHVTAVNVNNNNNVGTNIIRIGTNSRRYDAN